MIAGESRWEAGSEFHWMQIRSFTEKSPFSGKAHLYSCARMALASLLQFGMNELGWKRLWIPAYNCPESVSTILSTGIEVGVYFDNPVDEVSAPKRIRSGDVISVVNYFGLKEMTEYKEVFNAGIPVIEDHTHDPWSKWATQSIADYSIASLRKTLPIPDGGALWSNIGAPMPPEQMITSFISPFSSERVAAMLLKSIYLSGGSSNKEEYLKMFTRAKIKIDHATTHLIEKPESISRVSRTVLNSFPWHQWRELRHTNYLYFHKKTGLTSDIQALGRENPEIYPFSLVFVFDARDRRDTIKQRLIARSIYPAVIWPINSKSCPWADERAVYLSERLLSIHCDGRYGQQDMDKMATIFSECVSS